MTVIIAASEAYSQKNVRKSVDEALEGVKQIVPRAKEAGLYVIGSISSSFGCHIEGGVPFERVARPAGEFPELDADELRFGAATGQANPVQEVEAFFSKMKEQVPGPKPIAHFYDTRGVTVANAVATLKVGVERFDCSLGGVGGRPAGVVEGSEMRHTGNLTAEDWACLLSELEVPCSVSCNDAIGAARLAKEFWVSAFSGTSQRPALSATRRF